MTTRHKITMGQIVVRGHHKIVEGKKIWVEEYFRDGQRLSEEELVAHQKTSSLLAQSTSALATGNPEDPTLGGHEKGGSHKWNQENKQSKVFQVQAMLPVAEMSPEHRSAMEYHMEQFLRNSTPELDDGLVQDLDGCTQQIVKETTGNRVHAERMLKQLRDPTTQEGMSMRNKLLDVAAGRTHLDDVTKGTFEEVYRREHAARRTRELAEDNVKRLLVSQSGLGQIGNSVSSMSHSESRDELLKIRKVFENTKATINAVVHSIEENPGLASRMGTHVANLRAGTFRMEADLESLTVPQGENNVNRQRLIDSIGSHTKLLVQANEELTKDLKHILV